MAGGPVDGWHSEALLFSLALDFCSPVLVGGMDSAQ